MISKKGFLGQTWGHPRYFFPYPLRATKISLDLNPFGFWLLPSWQYYNPSEFERTQGDMIWRVRWAWFQISYSRWL